MKRIWAGALALLMLCMTCAFATPAVQAVVDAHRVVMFYVKADGSMEPLGDVKPASAADYEYLYDDLPLVQINSAGDTDRMLMLVVEGFENVQNPVLKVDGEVVTADDGAVYKDNVGLKDSGAGLMAYIPIKAEKFSRLITSKIEVTGTNDAGEQVTQTVSDTDIYIRNTKPVKENSVWVSSISNLSDDVQDVQLIDESIYVIFDGEAKGFSMDVTFADVDGQPFADGTLVHGNYTFSVGDEPAQEAGLTNSKVRYTALDGNRLRDRKLQFSLEDADSFYSTVWYDLYIRTNCKVVTALPVVYDSETDTFVEVRTRGTAQNAVAEKAYFKLYAEEQQLTGEALNSFVSSAGDVASISKVEGHDVVCITNHADEGTVEMNYSDGTSNYMLLYSFEKLTGKAVVTVTSCVDGVPDSSMATLTGGGRYEAGSEVTVTAPAVDGYSFKDWYAADENAECGYSGEAVASSLAYTFTLQEDTGLVAVYTSNEMVNLRVNGSSYKLNGQGPKKGMTMTKMRAGTKVTLEYTGTDKFLYWMNASNKVVTNSKTYTFTLLNAAELTAVTTATCAEVGRYSAFVEFLSDYDQVMAADTWYSDDKAEWYEMPKGPIKLSAVFKSWSIDKTNGCTVQDILNEILKDDDNHIVVKGLYENIAVPITVTIANNLDNTTTTAEINRGKGVLLKAEARSGYKVGWWSLDKEGKVILATRTTYGIFPGEDLTVYAQYIPESQTVTAAPYVEITGGYVDTSDGSYYSVVAATRDIPSAFKLIEYGVLYVEGDGMTEERAAEEMVVGNDKINRSMVNSGAMEKRSAYFMRHENQDEKTKLWVRGYVVCTDASGNAVTAYSQIYALSFNDLLDGWYNDSGFMQEDGELGENETPIVPITPGTGENETPVVPLK